MKKKLLSLALALTLALALVPAASAAGQFTDVPDSSPFASAVLWAVEQGVTKGTSATTFSPGNPCTVSHILTFLWRGNGRPGDAGDERAAVAAWASGLGMDASDLGATCTRATAVYDMWLAAGKPEPAQTVTFSDVPATAAYAKAVSWAVEKGVTNGTGADTFSPGNPCTRGHVAAFLYRAAGSPAATPATPSTPAKDGEVTLADMAGVWHLTRNGDGSPVTAKIDIEFTGSQYLTYEIQNDTYCHRNCTVTGFRHNADGTYTITRTGTYERVYPGGAYEKQDSTSEYVLNEIHLDQNYFLNSAGDRYERAASSTLKSQVLSAMETGRNKPAVTSDMIQGYWTGNYTVDGTKYTDLFYFNGSNYALGYITTASDGSKAVLYEEGTWRLNNGRIYFTNTMSRGWIQGMSVPTDLTNYDWAISKEGKYLYMHSHRYSPMPDAAEAKADLDFLKSTVMGEQTQAQTPAQPQGQSLDGYWTGGYTINGTEYTDIFYFNGSNYAEGTTTQASDGSTVIIYEEGTYRLDGGRIYFTSTLNRGWMRGKSTALDPKTYDWAITQNGNTMVLNTHTYAHVSDPTQASALLAKTRSLTGAR